MANRHARTVRRRPNANTEKTEGTTGMQNQKVVRGLALIAVALFFGIQSLNYHLGTLARAGAGLFPLMISSIVGLIGLVMLAQAYFEQPVAMSFNVKNIALIMASLIGFVLIAKHLTILPAILYLVFVASLAGSNYSVVRCLKISAVLMVIAFGFHRFLGLNLPLW